MHLYKYFKADIGLMVLESRMLRFTPPREFNDLFEFKSRYQNINESPLLKESMTKENVQREIDTHNDRLFDGAPNLRSIYEKANVGFDASTFGLDFVSQLLDTFSAKIPDIFYENLNKAGVLCLSENPNQPVMWGSYGDNHYGIALGFDSENEFFDRRKSPNDELRHLIKVTYHSEKPEVQIFEEGALPQVVSQKPEAWSYECEWRIIQALQDADKIVDGEVPTHLFQFPSGCLKEVIFGNRASDETRAKVYDIFSNPAFDHVLRKRIVPDTHSDNLLVVDD